MDLPGDELIQKLSKLPKLSELDHFDLVDQFDQLDQAFAVTDEKKIPELSDKMNNLLYREMTIIGKSFRLCNNVKHRDFHMFQVMSTLNLFTLLKSCQSFWMDGLRSKFDQVRCKHLKRHELYIYVFLREF